MTDQNAEVTVTAQDELATLKQRATLLGITFHPSIGIDKLRNKVTTALADAPQEEVMETPVDVIPLKETVTQRTVRLRKEAGVLVRVRVTCMNPEKREWPGEIFTVSNSVVGTFKKFVPFDNDEGWHVPQIILNVIKERKCQIMRKSKNGKKQQASTSKLVNEFAIEIMSPLTGGELKDLAHRQAMAGSVSN